MAVKSDTLDLPTNDPPQNVVAQYKGQKIDSYGLGHMVTELLMANASVNDIVKVIRKEEGCQSIDRSTVRAWINRLSDKVRKEIRTAQYGQLLNEVWDFERKGIQVRDEAKELIDRLVDSETDIDSLSTKDKNMLANIAMKGVNIQESGERFMGLHNPGGKRYNVDVAVNIDIIDQMREHTDKHMKRKAIDVDSEDVDDKD